MSDRARTAARRSRKASLETTSPPALSTGAVHHLAHDLRAALHAILGHSELLGIEAVDPDVKDSASNIHGAAIHLSGLCEDIVDLLRLPELVDRGSAPFALRALVDSVAPIASERGHVVRVVEHADATRPVLVDTSVQRILSHVVEHVVRMAPSDVSLAHAIRVPDHSCTITLSPAPSGANTENGILSLARILLAARGASLHVAGSRVEMLVPIKDL